jgi:hypothetical protein
MVTIVSSNSNVNRTLASSFTIVEVCSLSLMIDNRGRPLRQAAVDEILAATMRYAIFHLSLPHLRWLLTIIIRLLHIIHR